MLKAALMHYTSSKVGDSQKTDGQLDLQVRSQQVYNKWYYGQCH